MGKSTGELRQLWSEFECAESQMVTVDFCGDRIRVAPGTEEAWKALASVLQRHNYNVRPGDTDSYNCRIITGGTEKSLHSYGIALDVNWQTNPYIDHSGVRDVRYADGASQAERAIAVKQARADTDMTPAMIADVRAITTNGGLRVFEWGGDWQSVKDSMHFEIDLSPTELAAGIDWNTVSGSIGIVPAVQAPAAPSISGGPPRGEVHFVNARGGLRRRSTADSNGGVIGSSPLGATVYVMSLAGDWALVDMGGDGIADGYMYYSYLSRQRPVVEAVSPPPASTVTRSSTQGDVLDRFTPEVVKAMFPATGSANIKQHLPFVLAGLRSRGLVDRSMALMALATIRAETEGFEPISEYKSQYNTRSTPFDLYEWASRLGNTQAGDGPNFKGRGFVQLTGRYNYNEVGQALGIDLLSQPEKANDPAIAGLILAEFLRRKEAAIRSALASRDLAAARKLVNGGSHGRARFEDAFQRGEAAVR